MGIHDQLLAVRKQRVEKVQGLETLVNTVETEGRAFTDDEQKTFDATKQDVRDMDARIERMVQTAELIKDNAKFIEPKEEEDPANGGNGETEKRFVTPSGIVIKQKQPKVKGAFFAKQAHFLYHAQGNAEIASVLAERAGQKELAAVMRATVAGADSTTSAWAGALVQQETQDFIDLLRPMSVYSRVPAGTTVSFDSTNSIKLPKMTTGTPGGFVAEAAAIPVKAGAFTSITLTPSKLGVITVATREILSRSTPALETILRDSMLRDTAIVLDRRFISSLAAGTPVGAPSGLLHTDNAPAAIAASNTSNAADDAIADLSNMMGAMFSASAPMSNLVWLMHPSKKIALMNLRSATGAFYFRDELNGGSIYGYPVIDSTLIDQGTNEGGAANIKTVILLDASLLIKGNGLAPTISLSNEATIHMSDAPSADLGGGTDPTPVRSLYQTDSSALRLLWETTWRMRHTVGVQYVANVNW